MKSINEKEKKLIDVLSRLNLLNPENSTLRENIRIISTQKIQLEIEKKAIEEKYSKLKAEYNILNSKQEMWYGYREIGINAWVGLSYSF